MSKRNHSDSDSDSTAVPALLAENKRLCARIDELTTQRDIDEEKYSKMLREAKRIVTKCVCVASEGHAKETCKKSCYHCQAAWFRSKGLKEVAALLANGVVPDLRKVIQEAEDALAKEKNKCLKEITDLHEDLMPLSELKELKKKYATQSLRID